MGPPPPTFFVPLPSCVPGKGEGSVGNVINATKKLSTNAAARDDKVGGTVTGRKSGAVGVLESLKAVT